MREIKFRAWDRETKQMNRTLALGCWRFDPEGRLVNYGDAHARKNYILMQYTGLKDKNGKEIYEGDIVKNYAIIEQVIVVKFIEGCFYPFTNGIDFRIEAQDVEVIGNIYENPELLAGK